VRSVGWRLRSWSSRIQANTYQYVEMDLWPDGLNETQMIPNADQNFLLSELPSHAIRSQKARREQGLPHLMTSSVRRCTAPPIHYFIVSLQPVSKFHGDLDIEGAFESKLVIFISGYCISFITRWRSWKKVCSAFRRNVQMN